MTPSTNPILYAVSILTDLKMELFKAGHDELAAIVDNACRDVYRMQRPHAETPLADIVQRLKRLA